MHWYGLTYLAAFLMFLFVGKYRAKNAFARFKPIEVGRYLVLWRTGRDSRRAFGLCVVFINQRNFDQSGRYFQGLAGRYVVPQRILGVLVAMIWYARKTGRNFQEVTDFIAPLVVPGLAAGVGAILSMANLGTMSPAELSVVDAVSTGEWSRMCACHRTSAKHCPVAAGGD